MAKKLLTFYFSIITIEKFFMSFFFAIYAIFLKSLGLDEFEMNMVNASFMLSVIILEIPTGVIADVFGRKISYTLSIVFLGISTIIYYFATNIYTAILAEIFGAFAITFSSGAIDAWLVDSLKFYKWQGDLNDLFSTENKVIIIAITFGALIGSYVGEFDIHLPWLISAVGLFVLAIFVGIFMKEEYFIKKINNRKNIINESINIFGSTFLDGWQFIKQRKHIQTIMMVGCFFSLACQPLNMYWSLAINNYTDSYTSLGWVWVGISIFGFIGIEAFNRLKKVKIFNLIFTLLMLNGLVIILMSMDKGLSWVIAWLLIHESLRYAFRPMKKAYLQSSFTKEIRATLGSFDSMAEKIGATIGLLFFGLMAKLFSIEISWLFSGVTFCLLATLMIFFRKNLKPVK